VENEEPPTGRVDVVAMGSGEKQDAVARTREARSSLDAIIVSTAVY
jgi:hypothetical protein